MLARFSAKASFLLLLVVFSFTLKAQLHANFSATPTAQCAPGIVQFTDSSTGNITQWKWDLGNGTISFLKNPSATYLSSGKYTVKLVIKNSNESDSIIKTQYITVYALPNAQFTSNTTTGCYPLDVQFKDQSFANSGSIANWEWDFGDGFTDTLQNPVHTYDNSGNFNVTLRITNIYGCTKTISKTQYIKITTGVHAKFTNNSLTTCKPPVTINFVNTSTGTGTLSYQWSFGDGNVSSVKNPSHSYNVSGSYNLQLIATNSSGCADTLIKTNGISIGNVNAAFYVSRDSACGGDAIKFNNTSTPAASSLLWYFGDGTNSDSTNPTKNFPTSGGSYQVKMVANFGACTDSAYQKIIIFPKPSPQFLASDTVSCKVPFTVNFTSLTANANSYRWDFGDGSTSISQNPSHTYTKTGNYDVTLVVANTNGCMDSLTKTAFIKIQLPKVTFANLPDSGCAPFTKTFNCSINSVDSIVSYVWDFGDGTNSNAMSPTHTFNTIGSYIIKLTITTAGGCTNTNTIINGIVVTNIPSANFSANPTNVCAKVPIDFTNLSSANSTHWLWSFGDGTSSTIKEPSHVYNDTGYFDLQLVAWNRGCPDTVKFLKYVHINPPIAKFLVTNICDQPYYRSFTDQSIGADEWNWDFGDGVTSTQQSPMHTYADTGTYVVTLSVTNNASGCDFTTSKTIKLVIVKANFYASDSVICKGSPLTFTAPVGNLSNVTSYQWSFGDGKTVVTYTNSVTHTYVNPGLYDVGLYITDILGCKDTLIKKQYIRVNGPTANFGSGVSNTCLKSAIIFSDSSVTDGLHPIQKWVWNYGDKKIDTLTSSPFQHLYTSAGIYYVSLKVIDSKGCADSFKLPASLIVSSPVAGFVTSDTVTCPGNNISFINNSLGSTPAYMWNFGDGDTDNSINPIHSYSKDGLYTIKLSAIDKYGCSDSVIKAAYIHILTPVVNFSMSDSMTTCPPLLVHFTNLSKNVDSLQWDFGDSTTSSLGNPSHFYANAGVYLVKLTIIGFGGCSSQLQKQITIQGPSGVFSYNPLSGCVPLQIDFKSATQNTVSVIWDFNDGATIDTTGSSISHSYTHPGSYLPKAIVSDSKGCHVPITGTDTIKVYNANARFDFSTKALCDSGAVSFIDSSSSNDSITTYSWNFGDGDTSSLQNPSHQFTAAGSYYPQLKITTMIGCTDILTATSPVRIVASPQAGITSTGNGCPPLNATFNGELLVPDTSLINWNWDLGNGNISVLQNPLQQTYSKTGIYTVKLKIINSSGCSDTTSKTIEAYAIPKVNAGEDITICNGQGKALNAIGADTFAWQPAAGLSCVNCANPVATPATETQYILTGTTIYGCSALDTIDVKVKYPFAMTYRLGDTICKGTSVNLSASGANSYVWSPSTGLNNATIANPVATPDTTTNYKVIGTDDLGCFKDSGLVVLKVYPIPTVDAGPDKTINVGKSIDLVPVISNDVTSVIWSPTGAVSRNFYPGITVEPIQTTEYTVDVKNNGGCAARDAVTVYVICDGTNIFMPNTFSPNGDGANDVFYPRGTGLFSIKTLRIFNRWGEVVFEKSNFMPNNAAYGWDGTCKGVKLTPDVYVYTIDIVCNNNSVLTFNGNVALIK